LMVGNFVGLVDGDMVGYDELIKVGRRVGTRLGLFDGFAEGSFDGIREGSTEGSALGLIVGNIVGFVLGAEACCNIHALVPGSVTHNIDAPRFSH